MKAHLPKRRDPLAVAVAACFALSAIAPSAHAAYENVLNCNDTGAGSLRSTVAGAASGDTVVLNPVTMQCSSITFGSGEVVVPQNDLTIKYNGNNSNRFLMTGSNHRLFHHTGTGKLTLQRLTLQFGKATDADQVYSIGSYFKVAGGCVFSTGVVDLEYSQVKYCNVVSSSLGAGGGIGARQGLIMNSSILRNNSVSAHYGRYGSDAICGGAYAGESAPSGFGYIDINYSTVSKNTAAGNGGGLCIFGPTEHPGSQSFIENSTISGNSSSNTSGIASYEPLTITDSTISGNVATSGLHTPNVIAVAKTLTLRNSTIALNHSGVAIRIDNFEYGSHTHYAVDFVSSIVANNDTDGTETDVDNVAYQGQPLAIGGANNIVMGASSNVVLPGDTSAHDPLLLPLANNGGLTQTHAFRDGSPAFGHGNNFANLSTDQRGAGYPRTVNNGTDIGAFQQQARDVVFANGFD
ncbi:MAG: hypothetical protein DYH18_02070 [Xanthomonadales bacterium PRO7]|jgi:hypothetical protein|nr:hypothetical protein [Xanthomonadales bacterium PRO7]HMM56286.1 choice-of-anchor Q domain-containing protein [Rudaea sp.]